MLIHAYDEIETERIWALAQQDLPRLLEQLEELIHKRIAAFVSVTPPEAGVYSIDKYFCRSTLPFPCDNGLHEVRLLTVAQRDRSMPLAWLMMYAALRWIAARGGSRIVAIGRREVLDLYVRVGLECLGRTAACGECLFDLMTATVARLEERVASFDGLLARLRDRVDWRLDVAFEAPAACFHGGAFFDAVGPAFDALHRRHEVVSAWRSRRGRSTSSFAGCPAMRRRCWPRAASATFFSATSGR